jgi:SpoVK/Ycf46/Vps4 family AAA+-type ATPase
MATAEQLKALLKSHVDRDDQRFYSVALQVAAKEARKGHMRLAHDLKNLIEQSQSSNNLSLVKSSKTIPLHQKANDLKGLLDFKLCTVRNNELVLTDSVKERLDGVLFEQRQKDRLTKYGLHPRRKLLFTGPPGTGKTMSAAVLATELKLPLYTIVLDSLITRFMGETAAKLRLIFDHIRDTRAIYLFDEFDAIGTQRGSQNDVGEIRRVLNSFLMFVEQDKSESIIVCATNHPELLDQALYRRFDDIIKFKKPESFQVIQLIKNRLASFDIKSFDWNQITQCADGLSSAEVTRSCEDAAKEGVLHHKANVSTGMMIKALKHRHSGNS